MTRALSLVAALLVVVLFGLIVRWDAGDVLATARFHGLSIDNG